MCYQCHFGWGVRLSAFLYWIPSYYMAILGDCGCGKWNAGKWNAKLVERRNKMSSGLIINYVLFAAMGVLLGIMGFTVVMWQFWAVTGLAIAIMANSYLNS